jgi:hypothetical protein
MPLKIPNLTVTLSAGGELIEGDWIEDDNSYRSTWQDGSSWLYMAMRLKLAVDKILEVYKEGISEEPSSSIHPSSEAIELILKMSQDPIYMLLMGYAIENAIKGIIVCGMQLDKSEGLNKANFEDVMTPLKDGCTEVQVAQHGLTYLIQSKYVNIDFTESEKKEMENLKDYVVWNGRYPIKMKYDSSFGREGIDLNYPNEHTIHVNAIYDKAVAELNRLSATVLSWELVATRQYD